MQNYACTRKCSEQNQVSLNTQNKKNKKLVPSDFGNEIEEFGKTKQNNLL